MVVDICTECRGVFLDRGELDALVEAIEQVDELYARQQQAAQGPPSPGTPHPSGRCRLDGYAPRPPPAGTRRRSIRGTATRSSRSTLSSSSPPTGSPATPRGRRTSSLRRWTCSRRSGRERKHKGHSSGHYGGSSHKKHKKGGLADFFDF